MFNWMKLLFYRFNSIFSRCTNVSFYFSPSSRLIASESPDRSYFKRRLEQRSTEGSSLPDAWFQASRSRLSFKVGILIERRQKAGRAGRQALVSPLPQLFYPPRSRRAPFSSDARSHSPDIGWHLRCLEGKDYVRLFLGASFGPT